MPYSHVPVLATEVIELLHLRPGASVIDGTLGGGGHAEQILRHIEPDGKLLGFDLDPRAIAAATELLAEFGSRVSIERASYADLSTVLDRHPALTPVTGIVLDLGLSSDQLDLSRRGFSFHDSGELDMRFNPDATRKASDLLRDLNEDELSRILRDYGEIRNPKKLARALINMRDDARRSGKTISVEMTVNAVLSVTPYRGAKIHPATTVFQALRIAVNDELANVRRFLPQAVGRLAPGGRLAVISYHSLEDRIVKEYFRQEARGCICDPEIPVCRCGHTPRIRTVTRKVVRPGPDEIRKNPRSRSARLRVVEKI